MSFAVQAGETLGLVGESGSGKSVTAMSILRLVQPPGRIASGAIRFKGRDLLTISEHEMRAVRGAEISLIFQEPMSALNPVFTVGDQIAEALLVHGVANKSEARDRAVALLESVRIPNAAARVRSYPHQLSGGQRQRVMIAIALACNPALVIADEPTTALDVTIQAQILELLREMKAAYHLSLLLITHDLGVVAETADVSPSCTADASSSMGPCADVLRHPQHPVTRAGCWPRCPLGRQGGFTRSMVRSQGLVSCHRAACSPRAVLIGSSPYAERAARLHGRRLPWRPLLSASRQTHRPQWHSLKCHTS